MDLRWNRLTARLPYLIKRHQAGFSTGFEGGEPEARMDYRRVSSVAAQAGIVIESAISVLETNVTILNRGHFASVTWGEDYHQVLRRENEYTHGNAQ